MTATSGPSFGPLLRDAGRLALAHLDARSRGLLPAWSGADTAVLRGEAARQLSRQADASALLEPADRRLAGGIPLVPFP